MHSKAIYIYIYVHNKVLDESSSVNFTLTGSGTIGSFMLNDLPSQVYLQDIGVSKNGRIWAVANSGQLYYRNISSTERVITSVIDAIRVDGGNNNDCY